MEIPAEEEVKAKMDPKLLAVMRMLPLPESVILFEYVWFDEFYTLRSKARTFFNLDGSYPVRAPVWTCKPTRRFRETGMYATGDIVLQPQKLFEDPFRGNPHKIVLCETFNVDGQFSGINSRYVCKKVLEGIEETGKEIRLERKYLLIDYATRKPAREVNKDAIELINNCFREKCKKAGIKVGIAHGGLNQRPNRFWIENVYKIETADMLSAAMYILERVGEAWGYMVSYTYEKRYHISTLKSLYWGVPHNWRQIIGSPYDELMLDTVQRMEVPRRTLKSRSKIMMEILDTLVSCVPLGEHYREIAKNIRAELTRLVSVLYIDWKYDIRDAELYLSKFQKLEREVCGVQKVYERRAAYAQAPSFQAIGT